MTSTVKNNAFFIELSNCVHRPLFVFLVMMQWSGIVDPFFHCESRGRPEMVDNLIHLSHGIA